MERKSAKGTCIMASVRYWKRKKEKEKEKEKGKKRKEKKRKEKKRKEKKRKEKKRKEKKKEKKELLPFAMMELESIMLSEISQVVKD